MDPPCTSASLAQGSDPTPRQITGHKQPQTFQSAALRYQSSPSKAVPYWCRALRVPCPPRERQAAESRAPALPTPCLPVLGRRESCHRPSEPWAQPGHSSHTAGQLSARTAPCKGEPAKKHLPEIRLSAPDTGRAAPGRGAAPQASIPAPSPGLWRLCPATTGVPLHWDQPGKELWEGKTCWSREAQRQSRAKGTLHQRNSHSTFSLKAEFFQALKRAGYL